MTPFVGTLLIACIFGFAGILSLMASVFNWDWFFNTRNSHLITGRVSRKTARIIYFIVGLLIIVMTAFTAKPLFI